MHSTEVRQPTVGLVVAEVLGRGQRPVDEDYDEFESAADREGDISGSAEFGCFGEVVLGFVEADEPEDEVGLGYVEGDVGEEGEHPEAVGCVDGEDERED
jgi:hypothetical protein